MAASGAGLAIPRLCDQALVAGEPGPRINYIMCIMRNCVLSELACIASPSKSLIDGEETGLSEAVTFPGLLGFVTAPLRFRDCHDSTEQGAPGRNLEHLDPDC